jgi:hypothetical protein
VGNRALKSSKQRPQTIDLSDRNVIRCSTIAATFYLWLESERAVVKTWRFGRRCDQQMGVLGTFRIMQKWLALKTRNYQDNNCSTRTLYEKN